MDLQKTRAIEAATNNLKTEVEKLRIELHKKDEELAKERQEKEKLSADLDLAMNLAKSADELKTTLASAHETNVALQKSLWGSFPSECFYYYIKVKVPSETDNVQYHYLYVDEVGHLRLDDRDRSSFTTRYYFNFTKNDNGSLSITSVSDRAKYMHPSKYTNSSRVGFSAYKKNAGEFVLFFHPQNQQAGLLVDISSLAGNLLCMDNNNYIVANSSDPPANKFLIVWMSDDKTTAMDSTTPQTSADDAKISSNNYDDDHF